MSEETLCFEECSELKGIEKLICAVRCAKEAARASAKLPKLRTPPPPVP